MSEGCGRCSFYNTPDCKVNAWRNILTQLRQLLLECGLTEELKWKQPCYTFENKNILLMTAFRDYCSIGFVKGVLLKDPDEVLVSPGENSQSMRQIRITDIKTVPKLKPIVKAYVQEAINIEKSGLTVVTKKLPEPIPEELQAKFNADSAFEKSFKALTPGRQRAYILHFSGAKQSKTREARIEKYRSRILNGKGMND